jgi:plasmid stabilization system protein ParE
MVFRVEISPEAFSDIDRIADYIREQGSFERAERWFNGIIDAIRSLIELPERCAVAEQSRHVNAEIRLLLYGNRNRRYKIYFAICHESRTVQVFHVRHWAMKPVGPDQMIKLVDDAGQATSPLP